MDQGMIERESYLELSSNKKELLSASLDSSVMSARMLDITCEREGFAFNSARVEIWLEDDIILYHQLGTSWDTLRVL